MACVFVISVGVIPHAILVFTDTGATSVNNARVSMEFAKIQLVSVPAIVDGVVICVKSAFLITTTLTETVSSVLLVKMDSAWMA